MKDTLISRRRGRPRKFQLDHGIQVAQQLFHQRGYDGVSIEDICLQLGVPATSLYAAYQNKLNLYHLALTRYCNDLSGQITAVIQSVDDTSQLFRSLLEWVSARYTSNKQTAGCMLLDNGAQCAKPELRPLLEQHTRTIENALVSELAARGTENPGEYGKVLLTLFRGLSSNARMGADQDELAITTEFFCLAFE